MDHLGYVPQYYSYTNGLVCIDIYLIINQRLCCTFISFAMILVNISIHINDAEKSVTEKCPLEVLEHFRKVYKVEQWKDEGLFEDGDLLDIACHQGCAAILTFSIGDGDSDSKRNFHRARIARLSEKIVSGDSDSDGFAILFP